jgi:beta-xylosidase
MTTGKVQVIIRSPEDRSKVARWASKTGDGTVVEFRKPTRSIVQNALLWSCLADLSKQVNWYGQYLSAEGWKDVLTASLRHCRVVPGIDKGTFVPLGMRTSQMTIPEMSELLELLFAFGAEHGVTFTDPGAPPSTPGNTSAGQPQRSADASLEGVR